MKYMIWVCVISVGCVSYAAVPKSAVVPGISYAEMVAASSTRFPHVAAHNRACQERDDRQRHKKLSEHLHEELYARIESREGELREREHEQRRALAREQERQRKKALWNPVLAVNRGGPLVHLDGPLRKAVASGACIADLSQSDQVFIFAHPVPYMPDVALIMSRDVNLDVVRQSGSYGFSSILNKLVHYARVDVLASLIERGLQLPDWREHWQYCCQQANLSSCYQERRDALMRCAELLHAYGNGEERGVASFQEHARRERERTELARQEAERLERERIELMQQAKAEQERLNQQMTAEEIVQIFIRLDRAAAAAVHYRDVLWRQLKLSNTADRLVRVAQNMQYELRNYKVDGRKNYARRGNSVQQPPRKGAKHSHCS